MSRAIRVTTSIALLAALASTAGAQQLPGNHPAYLHALSDLRAARWFLFHQAGDARVYAEEDLGIREIDAAIAEMKRAALDDGKPLSDHPAVDVRDHGSRLLKAVETLKKAHADADHEEDNPQVRGLKLRILDHIDRAEHAAESAHAAWLREPR